MARLSSSNPLKCILLRQIDDRLNYCNRLVNSRLNTSDDLFRKDLLSHYGCVNAIEFSTQGDLLVSGGDDRRVLLRKVEQALQDFGKPLVMKAQHNSNIFCLGYDCSNTKIFSAGNDDQVIVHDLATGDPLDFFPHEKPVYGLSTHPENNNVFSSACDDGRILIIDIREPTSTEPFCLAKYESSPFHSVMFNPVEPIKLATANAEKGVSMWDIRKPLEPLLRYGLGGATQSCMNVRFNSAGTRLLALKRRLPPVLYAVDSPTLICHFDQPGYYNSCTMKSCCFAGDDESYVISGSDNFNIYIWKIPLDDSNWVDSAHMILRGHRSIVNHVRYNPRHSILASSGVEKIIKVWSPFCLGSDSMGGLSRSSGKLEKQRRVFTHDEYLRLVLRSGQFMTHDYSHESTREDPRMMAFFDSLVQREIEGWSSEDVSKTQLELDESDHSPATGQANSASDSDSTASDAQIMRSFLWSTKQTRDGSGGGVAPERPFGSPNRITRLIVNCRAKLMKLAALENKSLFKRTNLKKINDNLHMKNNNKSEEVIFKKDKSNIKSHIKGSKRKLRLTSNKSTIQKKCIMVKLSNNSSIKSKTELPSSESESDTKTLLDTAQPSTSTGLVNTRRLRSGRYFRGLPHGSNRKLLNTSRSSSSSSSSGNSSSSSSSDNETPKKRLRTTNEYASESHQRKHSERFKVLKNLKTSEISCYKNDKNSTSVQEQSSLTPLKRSDKVPLTPDSGIISGTSTVEKNSNIGKNNEAESSDREKSQKDHERFRKRVDVARKGYRKRSKAISTTDSSD